tara:strand:+ start:375 stop:962 length:588 start_codon:yes stop_codon:yes gene_type:complete
MIKVPNYLRKKREQRNKIVPAVLFFVILVPQYFNQSSIAENENPFVTRREGTITSTIIIKENPIKVWKTLTDYKVTGLKMPDIKQVKLIKESSNYKIFQHTYKAPYTFGQKVNALIKIQEDQNIIISYQLIKSNLIKKLEGFWIINPTQDGTLLTHSVNLEPELPGFLKPYFINLFESSIEESMNIIKEIILENE